MAKRTERELFIELGKFGLDADKLSDKERQLLIESLMANYENASLVQQISNALKKIEHSKAVEAYEDYIEYNKKKDQKAEEDFVKDLSSLNIVYEKTAKEYAINSKLDDELEDSQIDVVKEKIDEIKLKIQNYFKELYSNIIAFQSLKDKALDKMLDHFNGADPRELSQAMLLTALSDKNASESLANAFGIPKNALHNLHVNEEGDLVYSKTVVMQHDELKRFTRQNNEKSHLQSEIAMSDLADPKLLRMKIEQAKQYKQIMQDCEAVKAEMESTVPADQAHHITQILLFHVEEVKESRNGVVQRISMLEQIQMFDKSQLKKVTEVVKEDLSARGITTHLDEDIAKNR